MKASTQIHQVQVFVFVLLVLMVQSQDVVECGTRHVLHTHPLTVYQLAGRNVSIVPHMHANGMAMEWYVRPRPGTVKKELLKYLMVTRSYSLSVLNMSDYCQHTKYHYKWYADSSKKVEIFESARAYLRIGAVPTVLAGNGFHRSFTATEGSDLLDVCFQILGAPQPVITLYKITSSRHDAVNQGRYRLMNGCLKLMQLSLNDTGVYSFEGTNCFGKYHILFNISVHPRPTVKPSELTATVPHLSRRQPNSPSSVTVARPIVDLKFEELSGHQHVDVDRRVIQVAMGYDLVLPYVVKGSPRPDVAWYRDGHRLESSPILEFSDKLLTVRRVMAADKGFYQIAVRNAVGEDRSDFRLQVVTGTRHRTFASTMTTKSTTPTTVMTVKLNTEEMEPFDPDPAITGEDEDTDNHDELTWWIVFLIGIGCVSLTISLVLWIVCCGIRQRDSSPCICSSSHVHHNRRIPCQNQRWLPQPPVENPTPKAVNNLLMAAHVDPARDRPVSPIIPPPSPSDQYCVQYEVPLPLSEQEEIKVAELLATSPVRDKRPALPSRAELLEMKPRKKSREHQREHDGDQFGSQMRTLTWPPKSSSEGLGYYV